MIRASVQCPAVEAGGSTPSVMLDNCMPAASFLPSFRQLLMPGVWLCQSAAAFTEWLIGPAPAAMSDICGMKRGVLEAFHVPVGIPEWGSSRVKRLCRQAHAC